MAKEVGVKAEIPNSYRPHEDGVVMVQLLRQHMKPVSIEKMKPGDVLALCDEAVREPDIPRHLAFVTEVKPETVMIVHASQHGIREHRINGQWRRRIHSVWRVKE